jgi:hypothetical protein
MFHPSAAGYSLAATQLLPALCKALGELTNDTTTEPALKSRLADGTNVISRLGDVSRLWRRTTGVPAPIVVPATS